MPVTLWCTTSIAASPRLHKHAVVQVCVHVVGRVCVGLVVMCCRPACVPGIGQGSGVVALQQQGGGHATRPDVVTLVCLKVCPLQSFVKSVLAEVR
jgi:hypothetical protein